MQQPISTFLVDDSLVFLTIAARYLVECGERVVAVVGQAHDGESAIAEAARLQPQLILLDMMLAEHSGLDMILPLRAAVPSARIIILSMMDATPYRQAALRAGADGFVSKDAMVENLLPAIRQALPPSDLAAA